MITTETQREAGKGDGGTRGRGESEYVVRVFHLWEKLFSRTCCQLVDEA
jgi:hypothetical protein